LLGAGAGSRAGARVQPPEVSARAYRRDALDEPTSGTQQPAPAPSNQRSRCLS
jgi:hypothetical protein